MYYVNKAIGIDNENKLYWKRYAVINRSLGFHEEAEEGYRKAVAYGDIQLDTWLFWTDSLITLGEYDAAINALVDALEYFPEEYEIEYRLAGLYLMNAEREKGIFHLNNGLRLNYRHHTLLEEFFPSTFAGKIVQDEMEKYRKH